MAVINEGSSFPRIFLLERSTTSRSRLARVAEPIRQNVQQQCHGGALMTIWGKKEERGGEFSVMDGGDMHHSHMIQHMTRSSNVVGCDWIAMPRSRTTLGTFAVIELNLQATTRPGDGPALEENSVN